MTNTYNKLKKLLALLLVVMIGVTFTPAFALEAFAAESEDLTLELVNPDKTEYLEGDPIMVKATGTTDGAWAALYKKGAVIDDPQNGGSGSIRWYYVANHDGEELDITSSSFADVHRGAVEVGEYELILFGDSGYSDIRKRISITVIENPDKVPTQPADELSLKLVEEGKTTYKIGEPIEIIATGIASGAWVGLYHSDDVKDDPSNGGSMSMRWYYTAERNGEIVDITSVEFDLNSKGALEEGAYDLVLFGDGGYSQVITTISLNIEGMIEIDENDFTLETDKKEYVYGEAIKVKATGKGINEGAWVGLYYEGTENYEKSYLYYYYVREYEGVFTNIQAKTAGAVADGKVGDGSYEIVIFADSGYAFPVKKVTITVTREVLSSKVLREASCAVPGLEYVVYKDGYKEYREIPALGGHKWSEVPVKVPGKAKHEYTCKINAEHKKKVENCTLDEGQVIEPATTTSAGMKEYTCTVCKGTVTESISKLRLQAEPELYINKLVYNGKNRQPVVKPIYDKFENVIPKKHYTVTYPKDSKNVGTYYATVKFTGDYSETYKLKYVINPKGVVLTKNTKGTKNSFKATWKKAPAQVTGYQIAYSTDKNFKNKVFYKKIKGINKTSTTVKNLKAKKKFYIKVRTYKVVNGKTYYSAWSGYRYVTTKAK